MPRTHQITCAHDDCPNWAITAAFQPATGMDHASQHRAALAADGWIDFEGRDYCPEHPPSTQPSA